MGASGRHIIDEEHIRRVEEFLLDLYKVYKAAYLYPPSHPTLLNMYVKPFKDISPVLDRTDQVTISFKRGEGFSWEEMGVARRFPFISEMGEEMFKRRINSLILTRGLKLLELRSLIEVVTAEIKSLREAGGSEISLQGRGVSHIWFNEINYDRILEKQEEMGEEGEEIVITTSDIKKEDGAGEGEGIYALLDDEGIYPEMQQAEPAGAGTGSPQAPSPEAKRIVETEEDIDALIKRWNQASSFHEFQETGNIIINKALIAAANGDADSISKVISAFFEVLNLTKDERYGVFTSTGLNRMSEDAGLMGALLEASCGTSPSPAAVDTLTRLGSRAVKGLVDRLSMETDTHSRHSIHNILAHIGKDAVPGLLERLKDERWYVVRNIVRILGEIGIDHGVEEELRTLLRHREQRVRKEVVRAISLIGGPEAASILREAVSDSDERVVELAVISLGLLRDEKSVPTLMDMVERGPRSLRVEAVRALGRIGGGRAVSFLKSSLEKKEWFWRRPDVELKVLSARALSEVGNTEAIKALENGARMRISEVRAACQEGLKRMEHGRA